MKKRTLILLRHGESEYNKAHLFTGWTDVELSEKGQKEAAYAGALLASHGLYPDICFTSWLKRAIHTAHITLDEMAWEHIDVLKSWRLNERHYGSWQGQNKERVREEVGEAHFLAVRRGYDTPPPPLAEDDPRSPYFEKKYQKVDPLLLPRSESLKETRERVWAYYLEAIVPKLEEGDTVLVSAHGNSLRALVMGLENLTPEEIVRVEIPTGRPWVYVLNETNSVIEKRELA